MKYLIGLMLLICNLSMAGTQEDLEQQIKQITSRTDTIEIVVKEVQVKELD